jgi:hypothetical protein
MPTPVSLTWSSTWGPAVEPGWAAANPASRSTFDVSPAPRHRVARVDSQVEDDLLELRRVRAHRAEVRVEQRDQVDVLADQLLEQLGDARDAPVQVEHLRLEHLLAAEREELHGQQRGPVRGLLDLLEVAARGVVGRQAPQQELAAPGDDRH